MIVYNLNLIGGAFTPPKTDAPLIVNPNAMLPLPIASQFLKTIARRNLQIFQPPSRIK
jgi:hypothetical protein